MSDKVKVTAVAFTTRVDSIESYLEMYPFGKAENCFVIGKKNVNSRDVLFMQRIVDFASTFISYDSTPIEKMVRDKDVCWKRKKDYQRAQHTGCVFSAFLSTLRGVVEVAFFIWNFAQVRWAVVDRMKYRWFDDLFEG